MARYILNSNAQSTGEHEVHNTNTCYWLPEPRNRIDLGEHPNCQSAVSEARRRYQGRKVDGCAHCCPDCHTR